MWLCVVRGCDCNHVGESVCDCVTMCEDMSVIVHLCEYVLQCVLRGVCESISECLELCV